MHKSENAPPPDLLDLQARRLGRAVQLSFAADIWWLAYAKPAFLGEQNFAVDLSPDLSQLAPFLIALGGLYLGRRIAVLDTSSLSAGRKQLRSWLSGVPGTIGLAVFCGAVAFEIASYLSQLLSLSTLGAIAIGIAAGLCVIPYKERLLASFLAERGGVHHRTPWLIGLCLVRLAALCLAFAPPGWMQLGCWVLCVLCIPPQAQLGVRTVPNRTPKP